MEKPAHYHLDQNLILGMGPRIADVVESLTSSFGRNKWI